VATWAELEATLAQQIGGERLAHTYRVVDTARELSGRFGAPLAQAEVAALMHDYCRTTPGKVLLAEAQQRNLVADPTEEEQPLLLHGPMAAAWLKERGLVTDTAALDAVHWHTTGRAGMSLLEKVIWLADYIEPGRSFPGVEPVRAAAQQDLDRAVLLAMDQTITYIVRQGWQLHLASVQARNWLLRQMKRS
jgi:predicted HD superfamily hydrolase involved in NAD metabolism